MSDIHLAEATGAPPRSPRRHLLSISDLTRNDIERILDTARALAGSLDRDVKKLPTLRGRTVINLFYESSTRTLSSFELAAKRLSADTMSIRSSGSSVDKGESLKDTALTLAAYDPDVIVIRHPSIGSPQLIARLTGAHVVNAGDGKHQHPTQALLDLFTMREALDRLDGLHVASLREYAARWGLTPERVRSGQVVMHPGPMNRGVEIDPRVADSAAARITTQVRSGLVVRMAVLYDLLTSGPVAVPTAVADRAPLEVA